MILINISSCRTLTPRKRKEQEQHQEHVVEQPIQQSFHQEMPQVQIIIGQTPPPVFSQTTPTQVEGEMQIGAEQEVSTSVVDEYVSFK